MAVVDFVEAGRKLKSIGDLSDEESAKLSDAESQLSQSVEAGRELFKNDQLSFDDWKKLKRAELVLGLREPEGPSFAESARRIASSSPEEVGSAALRAGGKAIKEAPGAVARGAASLVNFARKAPEAAIKGVAATGRAVAERPEIASFVLSAGRAGAAPTKEDAARLARGGEAALRGVTSGAFGLGDVATQIGQAVGERVSGKKPSTPEELSERAQFERERAAATAPGEFFAGQLAGASATGGRAAIPAKTGSTLRNVTRGAAAGGATAGAQAALEGRDPGEALALGAAGGAAIPAAFRGGQFVFRPITDRIRPGQAAERTLAFRAGKSPAELEARVAGFRKDTLRAPNVVEVSTRRGAEQVGEIAGRGGKASSDVVVDSAERAALARQEDLRRAITQRRSTTSTAELAFRDRELSDRAFGAIATRPVTFETREFKQLVTGPLGRLVRGKLPLDAQRLIDKARVNSETVSITAREADDIRQALNEIATDVGKSGGKRIRAFADRVREVIEEDVPEAGDALRAARRRAQFAGSASEGSEGGFKFGQTIRSANAQKFGDVTTRATAPSRRGVSAGARSALVEETGTSQGSARIARSLSEDASLRVKLSAAFGGKEAERLARAGAGETGALRNTAAATVAAKGTKSALEKADELSQIIEGTAILSGRASAGFATSFLKRLRDEFRIPPTAAKRLAELATDRENVDEVVRRLKAARLRDQQIIDLFQSSAAAAALANEQASRS